MAETNRFHHLISFQQRRRHPARSRLLRLQEEQCFARVGGEVVLQTALDLAIECALAAGHLLRAERDRGVRGSGSHADVDEEVEREIRGQLEAAFPQWSYLGEETGDSLRSFEYCWLRFRCSGHGLSCAADRRAASRPVAVPVPVPAGAGRWTASRSLSGC
jgi:hypothetical protein